VLDDLSRSTNHRLLVCLWLHSLWLVICACVSHLSLHKAHATRQAQLTQRSSPSLSWLVLVLSQISLTPHTPQAHDTRPSLSFGKGLARRRVPGLAVPGTFPQRGSVEQVPGEAGSASTPPERHKAQPSRAPAHTAVLLWPLPRAQAPHVGCGGGHGTGRKLRDQWAIIISQPPPLPPSSPLLPATGSSSPSSSSSKPANTLSYKTQGHKQP